MKGFWRWLAEGLISIPSVVLESFNSYPRSERELGSGVFIAIVSSAVGIVVIGLWAFLPFSIGVLLVLHGLYLDEKR